MRRMAAMLVAAALTPAAAGGSAPCERWREPVVTSVAVFVGRTGERPRRLRDGRLELARGEAVTLELEGRDQWGDPFPEERAAFGIDPGRRCRGLVTVRQDAPVRFRVRAGDGTGSCRLLLWAAGNLNLDREIEIRVVPLARAGYDPVEAGWIARCLYLGLLGREADPVGLRAATAEIARGRLEAQVRAMVSSREFAEVRRRLTHAGLLDQLYRGLLGRPVDPEGRRHFLPMLAREGPAAVALGIVRSDEFESRMLRETSRRRR